MSKSLDILGLEKSEVAMVGDYMTQTLCQVLT